MRDFNFNGPKKSQHLISKAVKGFVAGSAFVFMMLIPFHLIRHEQKDHFDLLNDYRYIFLFSLLFGGFHGTLFGIFVGVHQAKGSPCKRIFWVTIPCIGLLTALGILAWSTMGGWLGLMLGYVTSSYILLQSHRNSF